MSNAIEFTDGSRLTITDEFKKSPTHWSHKFVYDGSSFVDKTLEKGVKYIITNWETRCEIIGSIDGSFEIVELMGPTLRKGEEYLLIKPAF